VKSGLAASNSDAARVIQDGGAYVNDEPVGDPKDVIDADAINKNAIVLRRGKKRYCRVDITSE